MCMSHGCKVTDTFCDISQSVACLFIFLSLAFHKQSCSRLMKSDLPFCMVMFFILLEKSLPGPSSIRHLCSLPAALCLVPTFGSVIHFKVMFVKVSVGPEARVHPHASHTIAAECLRGQPSPGNLVLRRESVDNVCTGHVDPVLTRHMRPPLCWTTWSVQCRFIQRNLSSRT